MNDQLKIAEATEVDDPIVANFILISRKMTARSEWKILMMMQQITCLLLPGVTSLATNTPQYWSRSN